MAANSPDYHLAELELARTTGDERRILPDIPAGCCRVLDVGCGAGQTLLACCPEGPAAVGVDYDFSAVQLSKQLHVPAVILCASGEALPFRAASFDFVYSRVALPYMNIPVVLADMARVLKPGGRIWVAVHPLRMLSLKHALRHPRSAVFELYRLGNTALLHWTGTLIRYPLSRGRMESYQTRGAMGRMLRRAGFVDIELREQGTQFIVTARKP